MKWLMAAVCGTAIAVHHHGVAQNPCDAGMPVTFTNVDVLTMQSATLLRDQTVLVRDGQVNAIGSTASHLEIPANACRVDGRGRVLMPGLADMHVHTSEAEMPLYLANGITLARELNGSPAMADLRDRIAAGKTPGPRLIVASPLLTTQNLAFHHRLITSADDARAAAREAKAAGYDLLKIYDGISLAEYAALREEGRRLGLPLDGHIPADVGLDTVLASGQTIEHMDKVVFALGGHSMDTTAFARLRAAFTAHPVWVVPTLASLRALAMAGTQEYRDRLASPMMAYVDSATVAWWESMANGRARPDAPGPFYTYEIAAMNALRDVHTQMMLGTDCANPLMVCGFAVYDELVALTRDAKLSNYEALQLATSNVGAFLRDSTVGVIQTGSRADMILLDGNPLDNLAVLQRPRGVLVAGRWLDRTALDALLQTARLR